LDAIRRLEIELQVSLEKISHPFDPYSLYDPVTKKIKGFFFQ